MAKNFNNIIVELLNTKSELAQAILDDDYEVAHSLEDQLMVKGLEWIQVSNDVLEMQSIAAICLDTRRIDFPRYCA